MKDRCRAFVFLDVIPGQEKKFLKKLLQYDEVIEAHIIAGKYDVLAVLEFQLLGKGLFTSAQEIITQFVIEKIRKLKNVRDTNTIFPTFSLTKKE